MESSQQEQDASEATAEPGTESKAQWIKPEVNRLVAGSAEFGDTASPDGSFVS